MNKFLVITSASLMLALGAGSAFAQVEPDRRTRVEVKTLIQVRLESSKGDVVKERKIPVRATYTEQSDEGRRRRVYTAFEDGSGVYDQPVEVLIDGAGDFEVTRGSLPAGLTAALETERAGKDPIWRLLDGVPSRGAEGWEIPRSLVAVLMGVKEADLISCDAVGRARGSHDPRQAKHLVFDLSAELAPGTTVGGLVLGAKNHFSMQVRLDRLPSGLAVKLRQLLTGPLVSIVGVPRIPANLRLRYRLQKAQRFTEQEPQREREETSQSDQASFELTPSASEPWNRLLASFLPRRTPEIAPKKGLTGQLSR